MTREKIHHFHLRPWPVDHREHEWLPDTNERSMHLHTSCSGAIPMGHDRNRGGTQLVVSAGEDHSLYGQTHVHDHAVLTFPDREHSAALQHGVLLP